MLRLIDRSLACFAVECIVDKTRISSHRLQLLIVRDSLTESSDVDRLAHHSRKYLQDTDRQRQRGREAVCGGTGWRRGSECERDWSRALLRCVPLRLCAATVPCCMSTQRLLKTFW